MADTKLIDFFGDKDREEKFYEDIHKKAKQSNINAIIQSIKQNLHNCKKGQFFTYKAIIEANSNVNFLSHQTSKENVDIALNQIGLSEADF